MQDKEIIEKWKQGLSKEQLAKHIEKLIKYQNW